mmetsp:Transcript_25441/g.71139  ORF Transcript_25441/g.71139 Transcript_25441/m.71139 type:complete len:232 (-) Transcript_25441:244-939(-)
MQGEQQRLWPAQLCREESQTPVWRRAGPAPAACEGRPPPRRVQGCLYPAGCCCLPAAPDGGGLVGRERWRLPQPATPPPPRCCAPFPLRRCRPAGHRPPSPPHLPGGEQVLIFPEEAAKGGPRMCLPAAVSWPQVLQGASPWRSRTAWGWAQLQGPRAGRAGLRARRPVGAHPPEECCGRRSCAGGQPRPWPPAGCPLPGCPPGAPTGGLHCKSPGNLAPRHRLPPGEPFC